MNEDEWNEKSSVSLLIWASLWWHFIASNLLSTYNLLFIACMSVLDILFHVSQEISLLISGYDLCTAKVKWWTIVSLLVWLLQWWHILLDHFSPLVGVLQVLYAHCKSPSWIASDLGQSSDLNLYKEFMRWACTKTNHGRMRMMPYCFLFFWSLQNGILLL